MPQRNPNPKEEAEQQQQQQQPSGTKRKRNLPGTPDPDAEVVALSPKTLLSASTFPCEVCGKEFRRDQNLQIHRRGHNLPWKRSSSPKPPGSAAGGKKVYICPEAGCVYHEPSRALGDLTGIKKHYSRKHGEKRWGCERCSKRYAVRTDWKAHSRVCGSREYECACGTLFSNKDTFLIHKASSSSCGGGHLPPPPPEEEHHSNPNHPQPLNNELMFPSLWGKTKSEPELASQEPQAGAKS